MVDRSRVPKAESRFNFFITDGTTTLKNAVHTHFPNPLDNTKRCASLSTVLFKRLLTNVVTFVENGK